MNPNFTLIDFENVLYLKNQLLQVSTEKLIEIYNDYENYIAFLDTVAVLTHIDSAFLLFRDDFQNKIERIIQIHRFTTDDQEIKDVVNSIISYLNKIKTLSEQYKNRLKIGYISYQEDMRKSSFPEEETFLYSIAYDAFVYAALKENNMNLIKDEDRFLSSLNYLLETIPEFFQDKWVKERAMGKVEELENKKWPFHPKIHKYAKKTNIYLKGKTKKEE